MDIKFYTTSMTDPESVRTIVRHVVKGAIDPHSPSH
jgi:hypothetical protein